MLNLSHNNNIMTELIDTTFATALVLWAGSAIAFFAASEYVFMVFSIATIFVTFAAFTLPLINYFIKRHK